MGTQPLLTTFVFSTSMRWDRCREACRCSHGTHLFGDTTFISWTSIFLKIGSYYSSWHVARYCFLHSGSWTVSKRLLRFQERGEECTFESHHGQGWVRFATSQFEFVVIWHKDKPNGEWELGGLLSYAPVERWLPVFEDSALAVLVELCLKRALYLGRYRWNRSISVCNPKLHWGRKKKGRFLKKPTVSWSRIKVPTWCHTEPPPAFSIVGISMVDPETGY